MSSPASSSQSPPLPDALLTPFATGEAAVTHVKRFCFASSRRTCRLERKKSGGNCKLLVCASNQADCDNSTATCEWFVRVNRSRKPNERGWRVRDANLQHSERCLVMQEETGGGTGNNIRRRSVPDVRTIAHELLRGSVGTTTSSSNVSSISGRPATTAAGDTNTEAAGTHSNSLKTLAVDADTTARALRTHIKSQLDVDVKKRTLYRLKTRLLRMQDKLTGVGDGGGTSAAIGINAGTNGFVAGATVAGAGASGGGDSSCSAGAAERYAKSFQWIESLLNQFCNLNPRSVVELQVDAQEKRFQRAIVIPKHFKDAVVNNNQAVRPAVQRALGFQTQSLIITRLGFTGVQVNVVARDGNLQDFVVAMAILPNQDNQSFRWMLDKLKAAGIDFKTLGLLVYCDRSPNNSGFVRAALEVYPSLSETNLIFSLGHILSYMLKVKLISKPEQGYVKHAQAAQRMEDFRASLDNLRVFRPLAASFLESLDPRTWALCANIDRRLYGWDGENLASGDPASSSVGDYQSPFECLYEGMNAMMKDIFERSVKARNWSSNNSNSNSMRVTPEAQRLLDQELSVIDDYDVRPCNPELVYVRHVSKSIDHRMRKVHFTERSCTCTSYQQLGVPCRHIGAALKFAGKMDMVYEFFEECYSVRSYAEAFADKFIQIPLEEDLQVNPSILPPEPESEPASDVPSPGGASRTHKRKAQLDGESPSSARVPRSYKCSVCGTRDGHNKKTCARAPARSQHHSSSAAR